MKLRFNAIYPRVYIGDARSERFNGHSFFTLIAAVLIIPSPGTSVCDKSTCRLNTGSTIVFHRTHDIYRVYTRRVREIFFFDALSCKDVRRVIRVYVD